MVCSNSLIISKAHNGMDLPRVTIMFIILELEQGLWKDRPGPPWLPALLEPNQEILHKAALEGSS